MSAKKRSGGPSSAPAGAHGRATATGAVSVASPMDIWDKIAWVCLHLLVILVPIAMTNFGPFNINHAPLTYDQFDIVKVVLQRGLIMIALSAWAIGLLTRGGKVRFAKTEWVILAFLAWVVLTTVFSVHVPTAVFGKYRRFEGLLSFITYAATLFMVLQMVTNSARMRSLARSLAIGGFLVSWYGFIQVIGTVPIGAARVLRVVSAILSAVVPIALGYLAYSRFADDPETRRACWIGAVVAFLGGITFAMGLGANITYATSQSLSAVSIDPIQWGRLPFETHRAFSTFGNPDLLGGYLIFPWAITIGLALSEKHRVWKVLYWSFSVLNAIIGITSYVRGAWIGASVSLVVMVVAYIIGRKGTDSSLDVIDKAFMGATALGGAAVVVASSLRPDAVRNVFTRLLSIFQFGEGSALTRFQIWAAARSAIATRPILGWGADTFRLLFPRFKPAAYVQSAGYLSVADNVHDYPLQLATGIGIPGVLLLYGLIAYVLITAARTAFAKGSGTRNLVLAGFWAAVIGYVVHLMFGLSVTGSTIMMWLSMGVLLSPQATERTVEAASWRSVGVGVLGALLVVGSWLNVRYIVADTYYLKGQVLTTGTERLSNIERAVALNPYNDMYRLELGAAWSDLFSSSAYAYAQSAYQGKPDASAKAQALTTYEEAQKAYEDMIAYSPLEYDTYVFLASMNNQAAGYLGDSTYARRALAAAERGVKVEQYGPAIRVQMGMAYMELGQSEPAVKQLEYAAGLDTNYIEAKGLLAEAYANVGRITDARKAYEYVLARYPDNTAAQNGLKALESSMTTPSGK